MPRSSPQAQLAETCLLREQSGHCLPHEIAVEATTSWIEQSSIISSRSSEICCSSGVDVQLPISSKEVARQKEKRLRQMKRGRSVCARMYACRSQMFPPTYVRNRRHAHLHLHFVSSSRLTIGLSCSARSYQLGMRANRNW